MGKCSTPAPLHFDHNPTFEPLFFPPRPGSPWLLQLAPGPPVPQLSPTIFHAPQLAHGFASVSQLFYDPPCCTYHFHHDASSPRALGPPWWLLAGVSQVNNAAPRNSLGSVNGVGQTIASAVRAAAPALGGLVWGVSSSLGFQGQQFIPFICVSVVALGTLFVYRYVQSPGAEVAVEMKDTGRRSCCKQEGSNDTA